LVDQTSLGLRSLVKQDGALELSLAEVTVSPPKDDEVIVRVEAQHAVLTALVEVDRAVVQREVRAELVITFAKRFSGKSGKSLHGTPIACSMAAAIAGAPPSIGSSPTPLAPLGPPENGASTRMVSKRGASLLVGMT